MKKLLSACAIAAAFVAAPASAQWYAGIGVGTSKTSGADGTTATVPPVNVSGGNVSKGSGKVYGGYQLTPNWGIEAQYTDLGSRALTGSLASGAQVATGSFRSTQYSLAAVGTLPLAANFSLLGKLGVTSNYANISTTIAGAGSSGNTSDMIVGVGVAYNITPQLAVRLEYEDFGKLSKNGSANGGSIRGNNYSLNLQYAF